MDCRKRSVATSAQDEGLPRLCRSGRSAYGSKPNFPRACCVDDSLISEGIRGDATSLTARAAEELKMQRVFSHEHL